MEEMMVSLINGAWKKKKKMKEKNKWCLIKSNEKKMNLTPTLHNTQKLIPNALQN